MIFDILVNIVVFMCHRQIFIVHLFYDIERFRKFKFMGWVNFLKPTCNYQFWSIVIQVVVFTENRIKQVSFCYAS